VATDMHVAQRSHRVEFNGQEYFIRSFGGIAVNLLLGVGGRDTKLVITCPLPAAAAAA
jgi:hypothetical protein